LGIAAYPTAVEAPVEPIGYLVVSDSGDRIHYLDWGGEGSPGVVLVHGLGASAWAWTSPARRLARERRTVAMDLRGHGLSDAPTASGAYGLEELASDVVAVAEGAGAAGGGVVLAGHGFGAIVTAAAAARLGGRCSRLVLVDGALADVGNATGQDVDEFLRGLDEPREVMRSMAAYLADRRSWDPASWDSDQERAARATVVETPAGRLVPATRPHALEACVRTMFEYQPDAVLPAVSAEIVAVRRTTPGDEESVSVAGKVPADVRFIEVLAPGHNLLRYRPGEVTSAILGG
jgi:pimeloyl-ACP methyl ester carboxylesterase